MSQIGDQFRFTQTQSVDSSSKTQLIESCSSNSSEESVECEDQGTPSQKTTIIKQLYPSRNPSQTTSSPVFPAKKRSFKTRQDESAEKKKPCQSPVFSTQTLKTTEVVQRSSSFRARRRILDQESQQSSQIVKSTPSTQINTNENLKGDVSHETTQISSMPTSTKSFRQEQRDVKDKIVEESTETHKREKPLKNGLEEQCLEALKNMVSDKTLNEEIPLVLNKNLKAKIVSIERALNIFTVACQNRKMESESYQEFDLTFPASDKYKPLIDDKNFIEGSDVVIEGPWTSFCDLKGRNTIGNVENIQILPNSSVIVREELTSETRLLRVSD